MIEIEKRFTVFVLGLRDSSRLEERRERRGIEAKRNGVHFGGASKPLV